MKIMLTVFNRNTPFRNWNPFFIPFYKRKKTKMSFCEWIAGQVDLWTRKSSGCSCEWENMANNSNSAKLEPNGDMSVNSNSTTATTYQQLDNANCACCVKGGCQCGSVSPARCGQCGLEQYCVHSKSYFFNWFIKSTCAAVAIRVVAVFATTHTPFIIILLLSACWVRKPHVL